MMYCRNCGKQLSDDAKFCQSCGATQGSGVNFRYTANPHMNDKSNSSNKGLKKAGIALTVSGFAAWMILLFALQMVIDRKPYRVLNYTSDEERLIMMLILFAVVALFVGIGLIITYISKSRKK